MDKHRFGFSTGALEKSDYRAALDWMRRERVDSVELSALRHEELEPLVDDLDDLDVDGFAYVSFHAPSSFARDQESRVVSLLGRVARHNWNIVVHPDVIYTPELWRHFGNRLLIENMDRRKRTGRTVCEISDIFEELPQARLCLDVAHARQLDTTLTLLWQLVTTFQSQIAEVHISELDSRCQHRPLSVSAVADYRQIAEFLANAPVIIESMIDRQHTELRRQELRLARSAMEPAVATAVRA